LTFHYSNFGDKLELISENQHQKDVFVFYKNQVGKIYTIQDNQEKVINITKESIDSKILFKYYLNGKLQSSSIHNPKELSYF
jgi:hypothetical protein